MIRSPDTLRKIDAFWASYFGCRPEDLGSQQTHVFTHAALRGYDGALVFCHGDACIVSGPDMVPEIERSKLRAASPEQAFDPQFLSRVFVVGTDKVSGPAWVGIADRSDFRPVETPGARQLDERDEAAVRKLAEGCGEVAWKQSKLALDRKPNFGLFVGGEIVAASGYLALGNVLAYVGVVTHPAHRGKGYAKAIVSASMSYAFDQGLVALWRTPEAHAGAVALGQSLGFHAYATTLDVQLVEDEF
jgi:GNAT superfamily N-acetyltransferase